jgi:8-oxo-dGTP diphosphatase
MQQASAAASASDVQQQQPDQGTRLVLVVAVALIDQQQRVLLAQRPAGKAMAGLWEFPGGKVDAGETPEAALCRELQEELSIQVCALRVWRYVTSPFRGARVRTDTRTRASRPCRGLQVDANDLQPLTFASHTYDSFHLLMPLYGESATAEDAHGWFGHVVHPVTAPSACTPHITRAHRCCDGCRCVLSTPALRGAVSCVPPACRAWAGQPQGVEGQQLAWVAPQQLREYQMPAADIPLIQPLLQAMGSTTPPPASLSSTDAA